jgi:hypothetical protein
LQQEPLVQVQRASQPRAWRQSHASESSDELLPFQQVRRVVQRPEPLRDQLRERAPQHRASRQPSPERLAPRRQRQASRPQVRAQQQEPPRQASAPVSSSQ